MICIEVDILTAAILVYMCNELQIFLLFKFLKACLFEQIQVINKGLKMFSEWVTWELKNNKYK